MLGILNSNVPKNMYKYIFFMRKFIGETKDIVPHFV